MPARLKYTAHRPRRYVKGVPIFWWVRKLNYSRFILRELSSVAVAAYAVVLILLVRAVAAGPAEYHEFMEVFQSPTSVGLNIVALAFVLFHAVTWFNLAPRAMAVHLGGKRVPGGLIAASNYAAWVLASATIAWAVLVTR